MTVVKTSNHHLYNVDASIYSNGNEKDNMILHYHQNPSANIIKNKSTNIFYATNLHFFYHTDGHGFSFHMDGRRESRILFLHTESHGWPRRSCQNCSLFRNLRDIPRCSVWMSWLDGHGVVFYFTRMVTGSHRVFSVTTDVYFSWDLSRSKMNLSLTIRVTKERTVWQKNRCFFNVFYNFSLAYTKKTLPLHQN